MRNAREQAQDTGRVPFSAPSYGIGRRLVELVEEIDTARRQTCVRSTSIPSGQPETMDLQRQLTNDELVKLLHTMEKELENIIKENRIRTMSLRDLIQSGAQGELITNKLEDDDE